MYGIDSSESGSYGQSVLEPALLMTFWMFIFPALLISLLWLAYYLLTLKLRRQERARFALDMLDTGLTSGRTIEQTIISIANSKDTSVGPYFHLLAFHLKNGLTFSEGLKAVPQLLLPQVSAMLQAGMKIGDISKVFPACRQLSKDAASTTQGNSNYLIVLALFGIPVNLLFFIFIRFNMIPYIAMVFAGMSEGVFTAGSQPLGLILIREYGTTLLLLQCFLCVLIWTFMFFFSDGPRTFHRLFDRFAPWTHRWVLWLPWRRKRLQRDFATMLSLLLDAGVPEPEAVTLAADCTANLVMIGRARTAVAGLQNGLRLDQAVQLVDGSGEFKWRITQSLHTRGEFQKTVAGWTEYLDAKAFQQEQAAAQVVSTGIVVLNGIMVGFVVISTFSIIVAFINGALLW